MTRLLVRDEPGMRSLPDEPGMRSLPTARDRAAHPAIDLGPLVAGVDPEELAARYGTPLFVYDLDAVTARVEALRRVLPDRIDLYYAVKANPSLALLAHLARLGIGADVASRGELDAALLAGFPARRIVFTGPAKTDAELERAVSVGIGALTVESLQELQRLVRLARATGRSQAILLRLAADSSRERRTILGGAGGAKFGLTAEEVDEAIHVIRSTGDALRLLGVHAFGASNVLDAGDLAEHARSTIAAAEGIGRRRDLAVQVVDFGGGLGIPYDDEDELDLDRFGSLLAAEAATWHRRPPLTSMRAILEPGRFLVGPAGAYLTRVVATKRRGDGLIAMIDGGVHHLLRPALLGQPQRIVPVGSSSARGARGSVMVAGALCTGLDVFHPRAQIPEPVPGDVLAIRDAGAYGFTESMPAFLSHPQPAEVAIRGGEHRLIRPRVEPSETLARQLLPW
jgi:diaminopimelate decarboxylase